MLNRPPFSLLAASLFISITFTSCDALTGEEVARLSVDELTIDGELKLKGTTLDLEAGERVNLWADMSMQFEGDLGLEFQLLIIKEGDTLNFIRLDPFEKDITLGEVKTSINGKTKWRFSGRMTYLEIDKAGTYEFQTLLMSTDNPSLQLKKADLVIKK